MRNSKTLTLVEGAVMIALATVLSYIQVYKLPTGGSITLLSMLPIAMFSIKHGIKQGLCVAFLFSLTQFFQGIQDGLFAWGLTVPALIACIMLDYIVAFTVIGFAGMFSKKGGKGWVIGTVLALLLRFASHYISGVVVFHSVGELWSGFSTKSTLLYSLIYNGSYMLPEIVFTSIGAFILFKIPQTKKLITPHNNKMKMA